MTEPGPADDASVQQQPGEGTGLGDAQPAGGGHEREVGVAAAVERGPAERSAEGEPLRDDDEHASTSGDDQARSTDDL